MLLFQTSQEIKFYCQHFIQVRFNFLGKNWGGTAPPAPPLATTLSIKIFYTGSGVFGIFRLLSSVSVKHSLGLPLASWNDV